MRTLRLSLAGTVILMLLGGLGGVAAAASDADAPGMTWFTGTITDEQWYSEGAEEWTEDDVSYVQGMVSKWTVEWTDPRLPSTMWQRINYGGAPAQHAHECHLLCRQRAAAGRGGLMGRGTGRGVGYDEGFVQVVLEGDGAFEGQYIILDRKDATLADGSA